MDDISIRNDFERISSGWSTDPAAALSLHKDTYIDPFWHGVDQRHIFHRSWQFLCHESQLAKPGDYAATSIQGRSVFVCRQRDGSLKAFYNVCKHRGHELVSGIGNTKRIICPYHSWTYDLDGSFVEARQSKFLKNFDAADFCLDEVRVEVFCHLVFVNLDPKAVPLAEQSGDLAEEFRTYAPELGDLVFAHRLTYTIKANWKTVVDNFLECYHCPVAHHDFCSLVDMDTYKLSTHGIYSTQVGTVKQSDNKAYSTDGASVTDFLAWFLWPNAAIWRFPGRGNFMVLRVIPTGPEETYEEFDFFFETPEMNDMEKEALAFIDDTLQPEDISLVESVQRGMHTPGYTQGRYMVDPEGTSGMSEHAVHHFHSLVLEHYRSAAGNGVQLPK